MAQTEVKRSELYRQVWEQPMSRLAKMYGLSDVGLAKICRKSDIPCPPRGYWAKKQVRRAPPRQKLSQPEFDEVIFVWDPEINSAAELPELRDGTAPLIAAEATKEMQITIAESLRGAHELVRQTNEELQTAESDETGRIRQPAECPFQARVSKACRRRALLILDALVKALEARGYSVQKGSTATVNGTTLQFSIEEALETKREQPDEEEEDESGRYYSFRHSRYDIKRIPSGRLTLKIDYAKSYWCRGARRAWRDSEKRPLETQLNKVIVGMLRLAARVKERKEEEAREAEQERQAEERRTEAARQRKERRNLQKVERARVNELLMQAKNWNRSQTIRSLIEAVKQARSATGPIDPVSDTANWIEWATQQADRLDPLSPSPPSILDEKVEDEPESDCHYGRRY